ncbi:MAG: hypothetical protein KDB80_03115, partial [Planctomycetes bacterium]|nr:hypothetical protein [Planctomycetota bacterium]
MNALRTSCVLGLAMAASAAAQSKSVLVGVPHALSVDDETTGYAGDATKILVKTIGFKDDGAVPGSGKPGEFPYAGSGVDYTTAAILQFDPTPPDIDAFSIGLDWILSDGDGNVLIPPFHWGGLTFSVTKDSTGQSGSAIRAEYDDTVHRAGGDLFFYILEGSAVPPGVADETYRAQDATEMDIVADPAPPGAPDTVDKPEMDAHDLYLALLYADNPSLLAFLDPAQSVPMAFFSVSNATKGLVDASWWAGTSPSGGTIFRTLWNGASWDPPTPFLTYADLGLDVDDEVDAVAVDVVRCEMLFSTDVATLDEILWVPLPFLCPPGATPAGAGGAGAGGGGGGGLVPAPKAYKYPSGTKVSTKAKLEETDKVDAICALDPGGNELMRRIMATPEQLLPWFPPQSWSSAFRSEQSGQVQNTSYCVGWPPTGPQPGSVAGCLVTYPGHTPFIDISGVLNRNLSSVWMGDPLEVQDPQFPMPVLHGLIGF